MVSPPSFRLISVSSSIRILLPSFYASFVTLSPSSGSCLRTRCLSTQSHSVRNSTSSRRTHFLGLFKFCRRVKDLNPLKSLIIIHGVIGDETLIGEFFRLCFHLGAPEVALSTFERVDKPSLYLQNVVIRCLCNHGSFECLLSVYKRCLVLGCPSDNYTFPFVIKACSALGALHIGKEIQCVVLRTGFGDNLVVQTALVDFYAKSGRMETARLLLDRISQADLVPWNALISGYSLNRLDEEALEVFREMCLMGLTPNASTLASIIPLCTRLGDTDIGKSLHGFAYKSGYFTDELLMPALISLYACGGDLLLARNIFDSKMSKNVIVWNSMISAYTNNCKSNDALEIFQRMLQDDIKPNIVTFVSIIPSCENFESIWIGESFHASVVKYGFESQLSILTALISMYAKLGYLDSAEFIFSKMPQRNLLSWNSMLSGYVQNGLWIASLDAFHEMQLEGFNPDAVSIICILSACSELEAILLGKSVHAFSLKNGFCLNLNLCNALLAFYSNSCQLSCSFKIFTRMVIRNIVSWNTLISGCAHNGEEKKAVALLHQMQQEVTDLDLVTIISVIPCYSETKNLMQGMTLHGYAIKRGFASEVSLANALISMYLYCGDLDMGKSIFEVMPYRSVVSWNALLTGYRHHTLQNEVMVSFAEMMKGDLKPNYVTLLNVLPMCSTRLQGKSIHAYAVRSAILLEAPLLTSLIFMYARFENINSCTWIFEMGEKRSISLWNAILSAHLRIKDAIKTVAIFCELLQNEMKPDHVTVLSLLSACIQINDPCLINSIMACVMCRGFDKDVAISNALIDMYARCGDISMARDIFEGLPEKDSISWSVMINGCALHGDGRTALALLSHMKSLGMMPDDITYVSLLSACSHSGLVEEGRKIFDSMVEHGILPRVEHYACVVDLLGRTGHLNEAYGIIKNLPHTPSISLLESLLGACITHGNVELGEEIGRLLLEMDPENSGLYVMLYNVYAAAGRWTDANRVRSNMEGKQLRKIPGLSLVGELWHHREWLS